MNQGLTVDELIWKLMQYKYSDQGDGDHVVLTEQRYQVTDVYYEPSEVWSNGKISPEKCILNTPY